jgi:hypothetical protein
MRIIIQIPPDCALESLFPLNLFTPSKGCKFLVTYEVTSAQPQCGLTDAEVKKPGQTKFIKPRLQKLSNSYLPYNLSLQAIHRPLVWN